MISDQHQRINAGLRHCQQLLFLRRQIIADMARGNDWNAPRHALHHETRQLDTLL